MLLLNELVVRFADKFKKVSNILEGWLVIKLSIIPLLASISHPTINIIRMSS